MVKHENKIRALIALICLCVLAFELSFLTVWAPDRDARGKTNEKDDAERRNRLMKMVENIECIKRLRENARIRKMDELRADNTTTVDKQDPSRWVTDEAGNFDEQIQTLLAPFVSDSPGRVLSIEFQVKKPVKDELDSKDVLDIVYRKAKVGMNVLDVKIKIENESSASERYVYVYERYWEQLTMNTRVLMALAAQAKLGRRLVVEPRVKDSSFGDTGYPFSTYYNVSQMNALLRSNGYSTFVTQDEFDRKCSISEEFHAILHFLYEDKKAVSFLKSKFGLNTQQYNGISQRAKKNGWTDCKLLKPYDSSDLKVYCVHPNILREWSELERVLLRDVKCLGIFLWRGIGGKTRTYFSERHVRISSKEIHYLLKASSPIESEAERFIRTHLSGGGYIAVQVRGEKVVIQHSMTRLKKCLRLLVNIIKSTQRNFGIAKVFVASDMSDFGSGSWAGSLSDKKMIDARVLKAVQSNLILQIDAVVYRPSSDWQTPDRGAVSLVELSLIGHAQHLLTIGTGSFQEWAVAKFLGYHRDDKPMQWSLTRLCSLP